MTRIFLVLAMSHLLLGGAARGQAQRSAPNIVIILADDLGYGDLSALNPRAKVETPNLDRLVRQGLTFTDSHSGSSVCTPTRYGLLTGRYAWRTRLQRGVLWPYDPPLIREGRITLPELLRGAGYATACIGKWHLGWDWPLRSGGFARDSLGEIGYDRAARRRVEQWVDFGAPVEGGPTAHGFDYYFGDDVPNFPPYAFIENDRLLSLPEAEKPDTMFGNPGAMRPGWELEAVMPAITQRATRYIREQAARPYGTPFFLYFPLTAPHTPIAPTEAFRGSSEAGRYGDYVQQVDAAVGEVLRAIEAAGLSEETLVLFTSDNGSPARDGRNMSGPIGSVRAYGHDPSYIFRGMKADIWEGGHRVPLLARWPGHIPAGSTTGQLVCLTDIMATVASLLELELPPDAAEDSYDLSQLLTDPEQAPPLRPSVVHHSIDGTFAIRQGPWKLILGAGSGGWTSPKHEEAREQGLPDHQLYRLDIDPGEQQNLVEHHPARVAELLRLLDRVRDTGRSAPRSSSKE